MTLIISESRDVSTDYVCEYLQQYKIDFFRWNTEDKYYLENIELANEKIEIEIRIDQRKINLVDVKLVWFRRGLLSFNAGENFISKLENNKIKSAILENLMVEFNSVSEFILHYLLTTKKTIGKPVNFYNKLIPLLNAIKFNIYIPNTFLTTSSDNSEIFGNPKDYITKAITTVLKFTTNKHVSYFAGTLALDEVYDKTKKYNGLSLIQKRINKKFDIRIFFIDNLYFPVAIFTDTSIVDSRSLLYKKKNSPIVKYRLPPDLLVKIKKLMNSLNLNTGSIDMMYENNKYYFIEVNPMGQFDYLTNTCYPNIYKDIANYFKDEINK